MSDKEKTQEELLEEVRTLRDKLAQLKGNETGDGGPEETSGLTRREAMAIWVKRSMRFPCR